MKPHKFCLKDTSVFPGANKQECQQARKKGEELSGIMYILSL